MSINAEAEKRAYQKFISAGMTPAGACGLIGNLEAESDGFFPNRVEYLCIKRLKENGKTYTDETYTAAVDSGKISCEEFLHPLPGKQYGYGLAQWTSPDRKSGLWTLAKQKGVSIADEDMQIEYLLKELSERYSSVLKTLKSTTSIRTASDVVLKKFEAPKNTGESVCASRAARGQKFYDTYVKGGTESMSINYDKYINSSGTHYISNSGHDENGSYAGGAAGDQGGEWVLRSWYNRPWNCVLRYKGSEEVRTLIAKLAIEAALNDNIGYDQNQRDTFWKQLQAAGYYPSKIKTKCEADCSAGVIAIVKAVGHLLGITKMINLTATYTGNMRAAFKAAGFTVLTASKYLSGTEYLLPGDILLNDSHHTATNITKGKKASGTTGTSAGTTNNRNYLQKGDTGSDVKTMQTKLIACGYSCGSCGADGEFGPDTDKAVRAFQKEQKLTVDGIYGPASKTALETLYNKKTGTGTSSVEAEPAHSFDRTLAGTYQTTADLWMRAGAGKEKAGILVVPKGGNVQNYGYYSTASDGNKWLYVIYKDTVGFCSSRYLKKQ